MLPDSYPTNWMYTYLDGARLPVTAQTVAELSAWAASTPINPWANNPLGMQAGLRSVRNLAGTGLAAYNSWTEGRRAWQDWLSSTQGLYVRELLRRDHATDRLWRAVNQSGLPAVKLDPTYPHELAILANNLTVDPDEWIDLGRHTWPGWIGEQTRPTAGIEALGASAQNQAAQYARSASAMRSLTERHRHGQ